jgi:hypothetical protein
VVDGPVVVVDMDVVAGVEVLAGADVEAGTKVVAGTDVVGIELLVEVGREGVEAHAAIPSAKAMTAAVAAVQCLDSRRGSLMRMRLRTK